MSGVASWFRTGKTADSVVVSATELADLRGQVNAISRSQAVIEFALDGTILTANENFLSAVGYTLEELRGQHHRLFVDPSALDAGDEHSQCCR
jgi:methyl-accepting chemotaxis protein